MSNQCSAQQKVTGLFNYVHPSPRQIPKTAALLNVLKTLELEILKRHFIRQLNQDFYPLWFIAETERNVFLWRHGLSLSDAEQFRFWIDLPNLIEKRLSRLEFKPSEGGLQPLFDPSPFHSNNISQEKLYLSKLSRYLKYSLPHLFSLSAVQISLEQERGSCLPYVLLP